MELFRLKELAIKPLLLARELLDQEQGFPQTLFSVVDGEIGHLEFSEDVALSQAIADDMGLYTDGFIIIMDCWCKTLEKNETVPDGCVKDLPGSYSAIVAALYTREGETSYRELKYSFIQDDNKYHFQDSGWQDGSGLNGLLKNPFIQEKKTEK